MPRDVQITFQCRTENLVSLDEALKALTALRRRCYIESIVWLLFAVLACVLCGYSAAHECPEGAWLMAGFALYCILCCATVYPSRITHHASPPMKAIEQAFNRLQVTVAGPIPIGDPPHISQLTITDPVQKLAEAFYRNGGILTFEQIQELRVGLLADLIISGWIAHHPHRWTNSYVPAGEVKAAHDALEAANAVPVREVRESVRV